MNRSKGKEGHHSRKLNRRELCIQVLRDLYRGINGNQISRDNRSGLDNPTCKSLTYGEIVPKSFAQILEMTCPKGTKQDLEFVDLGCGTGRAVFCAALCCPEFVKCWGIEIIPALIDTANDLKQKLQTCLTTNSALGEEITLALPSHSLPTTPLNNKRNELVDHIVSILKESPQHKDTAEALVNRLCLQIGHKQYQALMKLHKVKKFAAFIKQHATVFESVDFCGIVHVKLLNSTEAQDSNAVQAENVETTIPEDHFNGASIFDSLTASGESMLVGASVEEHGEITESLPLLYLSSQERDLFRPLGLLEFISGDIFFIPWWGTANIAYCASLLFSDEMMLRLGERVRRMKVGSWFITLRPLPSLDSVVGFCSEFPEKAYGIDASACTSDNENSGTMEAIAPVKQKNMYELVHDSFFKMSWQMARVYMYRIV